MCVWQCVHLCMRHGIWCSCFSWSVFNLCNSWHFFAILAFIYIKFVFVFLLCTVCSLGFVPHVPFRLMTCDDVTWLWHSGRNSDRAQLFADATPNDCISIQHGVALPRSVHWFRPVHGTRQFLAGFNKWKWKGQLIFFIFIFPFFLF